MTLRNRLLRYGSLVAVLFLLLIITVYVTDYLQKKQLQKKEAAHQVVLQVNELLILYTEWNDYQYSRIETQWLSIIEKTQKLVSHYPDFSLILSNDIESLKNTFINHQEVYNKINSKPITDSLDLQRALVKEKWLSSRMQIQSREIVSKAVVLSEKTSIEVNKISKFSQQIILVILVVVLGIIAFSSYRVIKTTIVPLGLLLNYIKKIEIGKLNILSKEKLDKLEYTIEIQKISEAFNKMIDSLKSTFEKLESEIKRNKEYNELLQVKNTELVAANTNIKQSEERFRSLIEQAGDAMYLSDFDGNILLVNNLASKSSGYTVDELLTMKVMDLDTEFNDIQKMKELWNNLKANKTITFETIQKRRDGTLFPVELRIGLYTFENDKAVLGFARNISERKKAEQKLRESEERFKLAMDATQDGIWDWDVSKNTVYYNQGWGKILGIKNLIQKYETWESRIHPEDKKLVVETLNSHLKGETNYWEYDHRLRTEENNWKWVKGRGQVVKWDNNNNPTRMIGTMTDIDHLKSTENKLIEAKEKAEESERLKSAFLANMSHEIRTPMNGIMGFVELLERPELTGEKRKNYINIIKKSSERMLNTVNDIIAISEIETGQVKLKHSIININKRLKELNHFFQPEANLKGIKLEMDYFSDQEVLVDTDEGKFDSIITNLIKNAIKFTETGKITVAYKILSKGYLEFKVEDTGIGIPKEKQEVIFERFVQADVDDKLAKQGSGLGLSITKSYVEMLGGEIRFESEPNKGTAFYFTLPYKIGKDQIKEIELVKNSPGSSLLYGKKILVAEDDEISFYLLQELIEDSGMSVIRACDGEEAIELINRNPDIELILMDIKLPKLDGLSATREIKKVFPKLPIIAQTAYAQKGDFEKALQAGCDNYITKPIEKENFYNVIYKVFKSKH